MYTVREFRHLDDYADVLALWKSIEKGIHLGRSDTAGGIGRMQTYDPELCLVAISNGQIVGALLGGYDGRRGMLYHLAVAQPFRKMGIGRALMTEMESRLRRKGCVKCYLLVTRDNPEALEYYTALGWAELSDVHLLTRDLEP